MRNNLKIRSFNFKSIIILIITTNLAFFSSVQLLYMTPANEIKYVSYTRSVSSQNNTTPYLTVDEWVIPNQIYQKDENGFPNFASVTLTVNGRGDPISGESGPKAADLVFVVDTTGSMNSDIAEVKNCIEDLVEDIKTNLTNFQLGLASYRDHAGSYSGCGYSATYGAPNDWVFKLEQDLIRDTNAFIQAVKSLYSGGGSDGMTSVVDAIYNTTHDFSWRGGNVLKIALLLGDGVGHDCNNSYGEWGEYDSTGHCPAKHTFIDVVTDSAANDVIWVSIGIDDTEFNDTVGWAQWNYLTNASGGKYRARGYGELKNIILELLGSVIPDINMAGKNAEVIMIKPDYISIIENSIKPKPKSIDNDKIYEWYLGSIGINETLKITYDIQSTEAGNDKLVFNCPETKLRYLAWNGTKFNKLTIVNFSEIYVDVLRTDNSNLKPPISAILHPINNRYYNAMGEISGTAFTNSNIYDLEKVEIIIRRLNDNSYWSGFKWTQEETWLTANGTVLWDYDSNKIIWSSNTQYLVISRAMDSGNNLEIPNTGVVFNMDMDSPISKVTNPIDESFLNSLVRISGNAEDIGGSGLDIIEICIKKKDDNTYWDGTKWLAIESWLPFSGMESWTYNASHVHWITDILYNIRSRGTDNVGNIEEPNAGITFMYDNKLPNCSIIINNDEIYTNNSIVRLSLSSMDTGSGVTYMAFMDENNLWSNWEPVNNSRPYILSGVEGEKSIYYRVKDRAGNIANPMLDSIILDTTPPENLELIINDGSIFTNSTRILLKINATDSLSGVNEMSFFDGKLWTSWQSFENFKDLIITAGDGEKLVIFGVSDKAGNIAQLFNTIILDTSPPFALSIIINNDAIVTNSTEVFLNLFALDNLSGVNRIGLSANGENWSVWVNYTQNINYSLPSGDGVKLIYFNAIDRAGNIAKPVSNQIILDTTMPENEMPKKDTDQPKNTLFKLNICIVLIIILIICVIILKFILIRKELSKK